MDPQPGDGRFVTLRRNMGRSHAPLPEARGWTALIQRVLGRRASARPQPGHHGSYRSAASTHENARIRRRSQSRAPSARRPVTCQERFEATRRAIQARAARAPDGSVEQLRWIRLELALVLAEATGRRIGAIRQVRWEDIDYAARSVTWRADADKMGVLWAIDLAEPLSAELRRFQARPCGVGGVGVPQHALPRSAHGSLGNGELATRGRNWLLEAERDAGLPKLIGGVWPCIAASGRWNESTGPFATSQPWAAGRMSEVSSSATPILIARPCARLSTNRES